MKPPRLKIAARGRTRRELQDAAKHVQRYGFVKEGPYGKARSYRLGYLHARALA
jgi:hypothetical protein